MDRYHLIQDAIDRGTEAGQIIENDNFMKEVLYGRNEFKIDKSAKDSSDPDTDDWGTR